MPSTTYGRYAQALEGVMPSATPGRYAQALEGVMSSTTPGRYAQALEGVMPSTTLCASKHPPRRPKLGLFRTYIHSVHTHK